jgi:gamma-D-glutamyl-L-lysine dipeptidyl-peptidase
LEDKVLYMEIKPIIFAGLIGLICSTGLLAQEGSLMKEQLQQKPTGKVEVRRGVVMYADDTTEMRGKRFRERVIRRLEPSGIGKPEKVNEYIAKYKPMIVYDSRVMCFDIESRIESGSLVVSGMVSLPEYKEGLLSVLTAMNLQHIKDNIEVLPSKKLGKKTFALVNVPGLMFYSRATGIQEELTESILGDGIYLLTEDNSGKYYYAQTPSGYLGWIEKDKVIPMTQIAFHKWHQGAHVVFQKEFALDEVKIPIGAVLPITSKHQVVLPNGDKVSVPTYYFQTPLINDTYIKQLITTAKQFLGTPYVWGGNTKAGIDCSGFVQMVYRANGINLARDADEQSITGKLVGFRGYTEDLLPGDTLYFAGHNGRITHTGLFLGNNEFIQATEPHVMISSLDPKATNYSEKHDKGFVLARRIINE